MTHDDEGHPIARLTPLNARTDNLHVVIDTPRGSRNKYAFEPSVGMFALRHVLPAGAVFPFDFGFVPGTLGDDGDPLDVVVLLDDPAFVGCLLQARLVGVIEAEQGAEGEAERNDRLVAVAAQGHVHRDVRELDQVDEATIDEIERFFVAYNEARGRRFVPLGRHGSRHARTLLDAGVARANGASAD